jgi:hypothetical protein
MFRLVVSASIALGALLISAPAALAQELVVCAQENEFCSVPYPTRVIYGVPGRSTSRYVSGRGIRCSNEVFGDPAPGAGKACAYVAGGGGERRGDRDDDDRRRWRTCANENEFCAFRGQRRVRYGRQGRFIEETFRNGTQCSNGAFGEDPAPGVGKVCQIMD